MIFRGAGGADVIAEGSIDVREPGIGEIQVDIVAAGLNRADIMQRRGMYPAPTGSPADVPGMEFSGRVVACGGGATMWKVGDEVMAIVGGGAMAKRITLHEREAMPVPRGVALVDAAAIPEVFLTAWDAFCQARLGAGDTVIIHAAASGVGTAAVQIARALGARPIATGRNPTKLQRLIELGVAAGDLIEVRDAKFAAEVAKLTDGRGADVILDCIGAAYLEENLRAIALRGRMVMLGGLGGGSSTPAPVGLLLGKRATVIGTMMRSRPLEEKIATARGAAHAMLPLFATGQLRPVIDATLPMQKLAEAHARMEKDENVVKILLTW